MYFIFGKSKLSDIFLKDLINNIPNLCEFEVHYLVDKEYSTSNSCIFEDTISYPNAGLSMDVYLPIGYKVPGLKKEKYSKCKEFNIRTPSLVAATVYGENVKIGEASWIMPGAIVGHFSNIGTGVTVWSGCNLSHHCTIGDFSWISPQTVVLGEASIGSNCFVGAGTIIGEGVHIGNDCFVGAGAIITKDLPPNSVALDGKNNIVAINDKDSVKHMYRKLK